MEFWKNDDGAARTAKMHSEVSRSAKPCSKIEAKLRSRRRSKLEIEEKKNSSRLTRTPTNSSSESEISPRFFTSKQCVELVNFQMSNIAPRYSKFSHKSQKIEAKNCGLSSKKRSIKSYNLLPNEKSSSSKPREIIDKHSNILKSSAETGTHFCTRDNRNNNFENKDFNKRRSRSAPCTPLFKIKCSKDKFPRDLIVEGKSLAANEIREKMANRGKNGPLSLRISRSGDVSVTSWEKLSNATIIERISSRENHSDDLIEELFVFTKKSEKIETNGNENNNTQKLTKDIAMNNFSENGINEIEEEKVKTEEIIIQIKEEITEVENGISATKMKIIEVKEETIETEVEIFTNGKKNIEIKENTVEIQETNRNEEEDEKNKDENDLRHMTEVLCENVSNFETCNTDAKSIEEIQSPKTSKHIEQLAERMSASEENSKNKEEPKILPDGLFSPKKLPKKREFRWETMLEKQHRRADEFYRGADNSERSREVVQKIPEDKSKFLKKAIDNDGKRNSPPKLHNSFEEKKVEAYRVIKQELPRLFMKRQLSNAMKNSTQVDRLHGQIRKNLETDPEPITSAQISGSRNKEYCRGKIRKFEKSVNDVGVQKNMENEGPKNHRPSILKRRQTPSPRRVTFRLPGRIIEDESSEERITKRIDCETTDYQKSYCCAQHRERKCHHAADYLVAWDAAKNVPNSPRHCAIEGRNISGEFGDFEQDWETPTSEDIHCASEDLKFPKETRGAMKILLRAESSPRRDHFDHCKNHVSQGRGTRWRRGENLRWENTSIVPSYVEAVPGKFQQASKHEGHQKLPVTTRQNWDSWNADAAVEFGEHDFESGIKNNWAESSEDLCVIGNDTLPHRARQEIPKFREVARLRVITRTMQSNGSESGNSENGVDRTGWTVGLINGKFKYLTAETFGFKINANGASLKKKQLWTLEGSEHQVFLRSHLDRYLAVDQFGNVTCEAEDPSDPGCAFQIQLASDGSGRWALKNVQRGYFLGSSQDELKCMAKAPGEAEYWLVHLAARPQVNLRSAGRKRFAHLSASQDEIHVDAPVPWGEDTLFTLEFRAAAAADNEVGPGHGQAGKSEGGHYALHTCNNKYLARDGKLLDACTRDCLYAAEFHAGLLALRDIHGAYLAPIGSKAVLKSRSTTVTRDELFSLEESLPQASFVAALNQRYVSVKQGVDVTANQDEISGHETFQLEFDRVTKRWYVRTMQDRYWSLEAGGGIQASDHKRSSNALFDLVWQPEDGTVALRANNGKFLATKRSGHLYANADSPDSGDSDASKYYFYLMNRPILVLRCEQGFVGPKSAASPKLECNKAGYETIRVERCERGIVRFKGQNGKYWHADSEGVTVDSDLPSAGFYLELREPSRLCIKCTDGRYLTAGKNGALRLGETDHDSATKWEF